MNQVIVLRIIASLQISTLSCDTSERKPAEVAQEATPVPTQAPETSTANDKAEAFANEAYSFLESGKFEAAVERFDRALDLTPSSAELLVTRGAVLSEMGELTRATSDFERAIELDSKSVEAHDGLAVALSRMGKIERALSEHDVAVGLDPSDLTCLLNRASTRREAKDFEGALGDLGSVISLSRGGLQGPKNILYPHALKTRAAILGELGRGPEATADLKELEGLAETN